MNDFLKVVFVLLGMVACGQDSPQNVVYDDSEAEVLEKDSTLIEIADLPVHFDSTDFLIHPLGEYRMFESRGKLDFGSYSKSGGSFDFARYSQYQIIGKLHNLKFQRIGSETTTTLTTENIQIKSITFLRKLFDKSKKRYLIYQVLDRDTNRDNELDDNDVESLYISNINGSIFTKLTPEFHELIDWELLEIMNRLYFRCIEDSNKNGEFDKEDIIHYHYVSFEKNLPEVTEYFPI